MAATLLVRGTTAIPLFNSGSARLGNLNYEVEGPFQVLSGPLSLDVGERSSVVLTYQGRGGDSGILTVSSGDPYRPQWQVALSGMEVASEVPDNLIQGWADAQGRIELDLELGRRDYVLILYSALRFGADPETVFEYSVGGQRPSARPVAGPVEISPRDVFESLLRAQERELSVLFAGMDERNAAKVAAVDYAVGDRRSFVYPGFDSVARQTVQARVVAANERAVAWIQEDLRADPDNLTDEEIRQLLDQFAEDYETIVNIFGTPSDVDGDGKVSFLFSHLVDDEESVAGFYSASSVLPEPVGNGNVTDMMFITPTQYIESYRSLLVHEFQHLINFNQHVLVRRGMSEASWLNEGLSHLAEDLVADHEESGNGRNIRAFLSAPEAIGLLGSARVDSSFRGASYLFVRGLVDRLGTGVLMRLVGTGLADMDNIEEATGEPFEQWLAFWGAQLFASGLGLAEHPRLNYDFPLFQTPGGRVLDSLPLPAMQEFRTGGTQVNGQLKPRGLSFVRLGGTRNTRVEIDADPSGRIGYVLLPITRGFTPQVYMPANFFPGTFFEKPIPQIFIAGQRYQVAGSTEAEDGNEGLQIYIR